MNNLLKFSLGNAKLGKEIHTFTLPSGYTCPGAQACMTKANRSTGKITDGPNQTFRCFAATKRLNPEIRFYAYTKSINYWINSLELVPTNLRLTASEGGKYDDLISKYGLKTSKVVFSIEEAAALGLEIDHDDTHAYEGTDEGTVVAYRSTGEKWFSPESGNVLTINEWIKGLPKECVRYKTFVAEIGPGDDAAPVITIGESGDF